MNQQIITRDSRPAIILMCDDDLEDCQITERLLRHKNILNPFHILCNGEELLAYLRHEAPFEDMNANPTPDIILLDIKMPRLNAFETMEAMRADPILQSTKYAIVMLTASNEEFDILHAHQEGALAYLTKPISVDALLGIMYGLKDFNLKLTPYVSPTTPTE